MKNTFKMAFLLLITAFCTLGCTQDTSLLDQAPDNPAIDVKTYGDLEFVYQVTDMEGNPQSTFREGENFMFSFVVKNQGDTDLFLGSWLEIPTDDDFFTVYKKKNDGNGKLRIGKSYRLSGNTLDLRQQVVPKNGEIEYRIPWLTQDGTNYIMPIYNTDIRAIDRNYRSTAPVPTPLSPGKYYSGFILEFNDKVLSFEIIFSIK